MPDPRSQGQQPENDCHNVTTILETLNAVVYVADLESMEILYCNKVARDMLDLDQSGMVGRKCWEVIQKDQSGPCEFCNNSNLLDENGNPGEPITWEFQNTVNNRWYHIIDKAIRWHDGRMVRLEIATDITDRKNAEDLLTKRNHILHAVTKIGQLFLLKPNWSDNIQEALHLLGEATDVNRVYIFENSVDAAGNICMNHRFEWASDGTEPQINNPDIQSVPYADAKAMRWLEAFSRKQCISGDVADFPAGERETLEPQEIISIAAVPIFVGDDLWGFIGFDECRQKRKWYSAEIDVLLLAAEIMGAAIRHKSLEKDLISMRDKAESASRSKSEFLATISHEVRTPLNGILTAMQLMLMTPLDPEQNELVEASRTAGRGLLDILNDILDFTRLECGKMPISASEYSPVELMQSVVSLFSNQARQKGIELGIKVSPAIPDSMIGDFRRVRQILFNVMGNAMKFTNEGRVSLEADIVHRDKPRLLFRITDTGVGIPDEHMDTIFEPFTQVDSSDTRQFSGSGLGLGIVQRLIKLLDGEISIESKVGVGTSVTIMLPCITPANATSHGKLAKLGTGKLVMLAEDDIFSQTTLRKMLEKGGHTVTTASNGDRALEALEQHNYDVAVIDMRLPGISGKELMGHIRSGRSKLIPATLPIIAISALPFTPTESSGSGKLADIYMDKPLDMDDFLAAVDRVTST